MVIAVALILGLVSLANAEHQKAEEYRQILQSGTFYVEYADVVNSQAEQHQMLVEDKGTRIKWKNEVKKAGGFLSGLIPFGDLIKTKDRIPVTMYKDGKYYQFSGKKMGIVATEEQTKSQYINPKENWIACKTNLSLPDGLNVFAPKDKYYFADDVSGKLNFIGSSKEEDNKKMYDVDTYEIATENAAGNVFYSTQYSLYYSEDKLAIISVKTAPAGEQYTETKRYMIYKITGELPEKSTVIPEGCKVYRAGLGDMDDLLENSVLVESF